MQMKTRFIAKSVTIILGSTIEVHNDLGSFDFVMVSLHSTKHTLA